MTLSRAFKHVWAGFLILGMVTLAAQVFPQGDAPIAPVTVYDENDPDEAFTDSDVGCVYDCTGDDYASEDR